jgi:hypothetical protein|tara:strand:+ start:1513 stop:2139 length:627 start_codon:yes stop_codon:yes gene_type:complete
LDNFIGNSSDVCNWPALLKRLETRPGIHRDSDDNSGYNKVIYTNRTTLKRQEENRTLDYDHLRDPKHELNQAYNTTTGAQISFNTYDPVSGDYSERDYGLKIAKWLGCNYLLSWVSEVNTGETVPPHVDDEEVYHALEKTKLPLDKIVRYHIHLSEPSYGAVFIVENSVYHMANQGDVFQWPSADSIHVGANASAQKKLTYHFMGYPK